jgi:transcriptional regulator of acetoin/glycerol metabolism
MITPLSHMREIERVGLGAASPRDAPVVQSWLRCLNDYKLDPTIAQEAYIVPGSKLREHREQLKN